MNLHNQCLNCIRWEGRVIDGHPLWKARCSQIGEVVEQSAFCIFWVQAPLSIKSRLAESSHDNF